MRMASLGVVLSLYIGNMKSVVTSTLKLLKYFPLVSGAIATASLAVAGLSGYIVALASDLFKLSGIFGTLPGIIGATVTVIGTFKLATAGMSDIFKELGGAIVTGTLDAEKFNESIKNLTPSARKFVTALYDSLPALKELRNIVQENFFAPFAAGIKPLVEQYLPMLKQGMGDIATILGQAVNSLVQFLRTPEAAATFQSFLNNVVEGLKALTPAVVPFAQAFAKVMEVSSTFLPQMSQLVTDLVNRFGSFIDKAAASGELQSWIQTGIDLFKQLIDLTVNVGSILNNIFGIADETGGGFLKTLVDITGQFNEWIKGGEGKQIFTDLFASLAEAGKALGPILKIIGKSLLETILPTIAKLGTATAPGQKSFFESFAIALSKLGDVLTSKGVTDSLNKLFTVMGDTLVKVVDKLGPMLPELFEKMADALVALAPELPNIAANLVKLAEAMLLFDPQTIENMAKIVNGLVALMAKFESFKVWFSSWVPDAIVRLGEAFTQAWKNGLEWGGRMKEVLADVWGNIKKWLGQVRDNLSEGFKQLWGKFTGFLDNIGNFGSMLWQKGLDAGKSLINGIRNGIESVYNSLSGVVKKVVDKLLEYLPGSPAKRGPLSGKGWTFYRGQNMAKDFARGIESQVGLVQGSTGHFMGGAVAPIQKASFGDLEQMSQFAQHILSFFSSLSSIFFDILNIAQNLSGGRLSPKTYAKTGVAQGFNKGGGGTGKPGTTGTSGVMTPVYDQNGNLLTQIPSVRSQDTTIVDANGNVLAVIPPTKPSQQAQATQGKQYAGKDAELAAELAKHGFSASEIVGLVELNRVETGNWSHPESIMGFTNQQTGPGIAAHVKGFKEMWDRRQSTGAVGPPAGVVNGQVTNPVAFADWLLKLEGYSATQDWAGNQYPSGQFMSAAEYSKKVASGYNNMPAPTVISSMPGRNVTYTPAEMAKLGIKPLYTPGTTQVPQWAQDLAKQFGLTASTYGTGGTLHQGGFAFDFGGAQEDMQRFAKWVMENPLAQTVQLIFQDSSGTNYEVAGGVVSPGYYPPETMAGHTGHVHGAFIAPIMGQTVKPGTGTPEIRDAQGNIIAAPIPPEYQAATPPTLQDQNKQIIDNLSSSDDYLRRIAAASEGNLTLQDNEVAPALQYLDEQIANQNAINTPASKQNAQALEGIKSNLMQGTGFEEGPTALSSVMGVAQSATGLAQDVFAIIDGVLKSVAATKDITGTIARGIANTEDIYNIVDSLQAYLELATAIAKTVTDSLALAAQIAGIAQGAGGGFGGGDVGGAVVGALQTAAAISGIVTSVISAINAGIDLAQEAYRIGTKYLGRLLMSWLGLGGYQGRVQYLLDTMTGELKAWAVENPEMKTTFGTLGRMLGREYPGRPEAPNNVFYIYQGPGQDPRDTMSDAMFAVKSSGVGVFGYGA